MKAEVEFHNGLPYVRLKDYNALHVDLHNARVELEAAGDALIVAYARIAELEAGLEAAREREKRIRQDRDTLSRFQAKAERREKGLREALERAVIDLEPLRLPEGAVAMPSFTHVQAALRKALAASPPDEQSDAS